MMPGMMPGMMHGMMPGMVPQQPGMMPQQPGMMPQQPGMMPQQPGVMNLQQFEMMPPKPPGPAQTENTISKNPADSNINLKEQDEQNREYHAPVRNSNITPSSAPTDDNALL